MHCVIIMCVQAPHAAEDKYLSNVDRVDYECLRGIACAGHAKTLKGVPRPPFWSITINARCGVLKGKRWEEEIIFWWDSSVQELYP